VVGRPLRGWEVQEEGGAVWAAGGAAGRMLRSVVSSRSGREWVFAVV
jgi:hypothetical protein